MAKLETFKFWCQKVLPLVYDDSLSYYEILCKVVKYLNNTIGAVNENTEDVANLTLTFNELKDYVNNYFDNIDVQEEINNKLDKMAEDGTLTNLIKVYIDPIYQNYENIINETVGTQNAQIGVLERRMDSFTSLTEGSTTADAELIDIRVGASGFPTYPTAGDAVRGQITILNEHINSVSNASPNLFNKDSNDILKGYYSGESFISDSNYRLSHPIKLKVGVKYKYPQSKYLGENTAIPILNDSKEFTGSSITGTLKNGYVTFQTTFVELWVRVNIGWYTNANLFMVCEENSYPEEYKPFGYIISNNFAEQLNKDYDILYNKNIVFDGDSICYGASDTVGRRGWAYRIGKKNNMKWHNVSESGGTISEISGRHNLCNYIETIHATYPTLDYLILEGGTNDADLLNVTGLGTYDEYDFSGNYDKNTFCGALDYLFYKATTYYPNTKIGFIIAMKMAVNSSGTMILPSRRKIFFDAAANICKKWGIPCLNLWTDNPMNSCINSYYEPLQTIEWNLSNRYYSDGQHPTSKGYDYITPQIEAWLKTL